MNRFKNKSNIIIVFKTKLNILCFEHIMPDVLHTDNRARGRGGNYREESSLK